MFEADKRELLMMLAEQMGKSRQAKAMLNWETYRVDVGAYLREHADGRWREAFVPLIRGVVLEQAANWQAELGVQFSVPNLEAAYWFENYTLQFAQPILATTEQDLSELLQRATLEGWSGEKGRNAIGALFERYANDRALTDEQRAWFGDRMPAYRRDLIGRVESMRSANAGSDALLQEYGAPAREWLSTRDSRTRDSHRAAGGQIRPFGVPFDVGGHPMNYPLDMSLGAPMSEVANCRCTLAPWFPEGFEMGEGVTA